MINEQHIKPFVDKKINLNEDSILEKLLDRYRWPKHYLHGQPSVEAIKEDGTKHQDFFNEDQYLNSLDCIKCYEDGYTLILSNVGGLSKELWLFEQHLNHVFNKFINCNFYFGNGKKSISFPKHNHEYPVMVKNIYGKSKWIIDEKEVLLDEQNVVFFDKFVNHEVIEIEDKKLSLTCNL